MTGTDGQICRRQGVDGMVRTSGWFGEKKMEQDRRGSVPSVVTHRQDLLMEWYAAPQLQQAISFLTFQ